MGKLLDWFFHRDRETEENLIALDADARLRGELIDGRKSSTLHQRVAIVHRVCSCGHGWHEHEKAAVISSQATRAPNWWAPIYDAGECDKCPCAKFAEPWAKVQHPIGWGDEIRLPGSHSTHHYGQETLEAWAAALKHPSPWRHE